MLAIGLLHELKQTDGSDFQLKWGGIAPKSRQQIFEGLLVLGEGHKLLQLFVDYFDVLELVQSDKAHSLDYLDVVNQFSDVEDLLLFCHTLV